MFMYANERGKTCNETSCQDYVNCNCSLCLQINRRYENSHMLLKNKVVEYFCMTTSRCRAWKLPERKNFFNFLSLKHVFDIDKGRL